MFNRLKNAVWLIVGAVVAVWAVTSLVGLVRAGDMEPWAPPGSTYKDLFAVEPRTPIWQPEPGGFPIVIDQPGSYYLGQNITGEAGENGIEIAADNVTLDLNGFALIGQPGSGYAVGTPHGYYSAMAIYNGTIRDWGGHGVSLGYVIRGQLRNVRAVENGGWGISVDDEWTVSDCVVLDNGMGGLDGGNHSTVTGCAFIGNAGDGISLGSLSVLTNSTSSLNHGVGISLFGGGSVVQGCAADQNWLDGLNVASGALITGNSAVYNGYNGDGAGIYVPYRLDDNGRDNRIEGNIVALNDRGIDVENPGNIIVKNSASGNTTDYDIVAGNAYGQIINMTAGGAITADPWANFRY